MREKFFSLSFQCKPEPDYDAAYFFSEAMCFLKLFLSNITNIMSNIKLGMEFSAGCLCYH